MSSNNGNGNGTTAAGDLLAALAGSGSQASITREGPGSGPGWQGRFYCYPDGRRRQVQLGPCGTVEATNADELMAAVVRLGGGTYSVSAKDREGKVRKVQLGPFSGEPSPLPGVSDPAAEAEAAGVPLGAGAGGGRGQQQVVLEVPRWVFDYAKNAHHWTGWDFDPPIDPPGPAPRSLPGAGGGGYYRGGGGEEDSRVKALEAKLAAMESGNQQNSAMTMMQGMMQMFGGMMTSISQANANASVDRAKAETERARIEADSRKEIAAADERVRMRELEMRAKTPNPQDPVASLRGLLGMAVDFKDVLGGNRGEEEESTGRIVLKVLGKFADAGDKLITMRRGGDDDDEDEDEPEAPPPAPPPQAQAPPPPPQPAAPPPPAQPSAEDARRQAKTDADTRARGKAEQIAMMWVDVVRNVHKSYLSGTEGAIALYGLAQFCEDRYPYPEIVSALAQLTVDDLGMVAQQVTKNPHIKKAQRKTVIDAVQDLTTSNDGRAWLTDFLKAAKDDVAPKVPDPGEPAEDDDEDDADDAGEEPGEDGEE